MIVENSAGIPLLMKPLSGNSSDKTDFQEVLKPHIESLTAQCGFEYIVADSALYSESSVQSMRAYKAKWITRLPETIKEAKTAITAAKTHVMTPINDKYRYATHTSNYGGVEQCWIIVNSTRLAA